MYPLIINSTFELTVVFAICPKRHSNIGQFWHSIFRFRCAKLDVGQNALTPIFDIFGHIRIWVVFCSEYPLKIMLIFELISVEADRNSNLGEFRCLGEGDIRIILGVIRIKNSHSIFFGRFFECHKANSQICSWHSNMVISMLWQIRMSPDNFSTDIRIYQLSWFSYSIFVLHSVLSEFILLLSEKHIFEYVWYFFWKHSNVEKSLTVWYSNFLFKLNIKFECQIRTQITDQRHS